MKRAELIEKWLEALESGEYKQGKNTLVNSRDGYCCLGVLCKVAELNGIIKADEYVGMYALPKFMCKKVNMDTDGDFQIAVPYKGNDYATLAQMNDSGIRFKTIAKVIREQLKEKNFSKVK